MELKVRAVEAVEEKSVQEVEQELLDKHEEKINDQQQESEEVKEVAVESEEVKQEESVVEDTPEKTEEVVEKPVELSEEDVLSYIGKRYGREIGSLDELNTAREEAEQLPEDVAAYFKYKKETGRGIEDYARLQKDFSAMSPDSLLREYITVTEGEGLDPEDIDSLMEDYSYTEDDDETAIKKIKLAKKKTIAKKTTRKRRTTTKKAKKED